MSNESPILFATKPSAFLTHRAGVHQPGFVEYLEEIRDEKLWVVHRLDFETSGAMIFARQQEAARQLGELFADQQVHKKYLFITDRSSPTQNFLVRSHIERRGEQIVSDETRAANSETQFESLARVGRFYLWQALPKTGKTHQIRLHAKQAGIPILGDRRYGGSSYPRLLLHSQQISFAAELNSQPAFTQKSFSHESTPPRCFANPQLLENGLLARWCAAGERREAIFGLLQSRQTNCCRWIHADGGELRADRVGEVMFYYWYGAESPEALFEDLQTLTDLFGLPHWHCRWMRDRGRGVKELPLWSSAHAPIEWEACENGMRFALKARQLSPGLFLDQRLNRAWVRAKSSRRRVLNLFCFTGGFSVAAHLGGASSVVSVDLSQNFLNWLKTNLALNEDPKPEPADKALCKHEFWAFDTGAYLKMARRKGWQFDLIVCDPPTFSRNKAEVFRFERDWAQLLADLRQVLASRGLILFCTNIETLTQAEFEAQVRIKAETLGLKPISAPLPAWDFAGSQEIIHQQNSRPPGVRPNFAELIQMKYVVLALDQ